jgi:hypothetical protein
MDYGQEKSEDQIRMEMLINDIGYILLHIFLFIAYIIGGTVLLAITVISKILRLSGICAFLSARLYHTKFGRKTRSICKTISHHPITALIIISSVYVRIFDHAGLLDANPIGRTSN